MLNNKTYYCFFFAFLMMPYYLEAAPGCSTWIAKAESTQGKVDTQPSGSANWQSVRINDTFCPGDKVRTAKWSRSTLRLKNESVITIDQNSTLVFSEPAEAEGGWFLKLIDGSTFFRSRQPQRLNIQTPFINAIHEGTEFLVTVGNQQAAISVFDGQVTGENAAGRISIKKGFSGIAQNGAVPRLQALTVTPQDAVQWALYYPPVITYKPAKLSPVSPAIQSVLNAYRQGDHYQALSRLEALPSSEQNAQILALKASLLLSAGRVDEANATLQRILQSEPRNSDAFALQAIIAITKNQQQTALDFAGKAVALDPQSSAAQIALSYAHQSMLKIEPALTAAEAATRLSPDNALAWARLSELQLSTGDHDNALKSAQKAQTLQPDLLKSQTILGFVHLAELNVDNAKQAFAQAITLDSSDPLPRLGLGLAKIKQGDVDEGKQEMETAVNLDPNNSVIRSYLGKAYYELRNQDYAGTEYQLAKEMDPKDPTPWFYDAILKQTINRPVEALQDMQKAIELNDNRGVYRSRLLLDDDSAARSASQGRIYNDLGFQQRGLLEGWNSVNTDPSNYSAHRLLSDNYAALPRHEIARVSELLKAQLLQPINLTPVQPQSAESNILLLDNQGSSITSFNEYNPLYTRNRLALQVSGLYGGNDTKSDEVVQSGVWDRFSYSLGQYHYDTDGFRENNDQKKDLYNFFTQAAITEDTNVQFEYRRSERDFGDINQGFFTDTFSLIGQGKEDSDVFRGGFHHSFNENADLLASVIHKEESATSLDDKQGLNHLNTEFSVENKGTQYELQQLYRHDYFDLTAGINYLDNQQGSLFQQFDTGFDSFSSTWDIESEHGAFYLYSTIKALPKLLITAGLSQDFYQQTLSAGLPIAELDRNPLNPKFGITWTPLESTTLRFAAFRSLKRGIIQKQTLEPTQVAGFNQFYDDLDGSIARRIGFGIDHKFTSRFFGGAEISRRYIDVAFTSSDDLGNYFTDTEWKENNARAYLNWAPNNLFSLGTDYNYEKLIRNDQFLEFDFFNFHPFTLLETHRVQLFGNFYHPSGFLSKLKLSYLDQTGTFFFNDGFSPQSSNFWLLDAEIGYRLPKRHGLVTLGVKNLLDEKFNFQGTDVNYPALPQGQFFFSRLTLSF